MGGVGGGQAGRALVSIERLPQAGAETLPYPRSPLSRGHVCEDKQTTRYRSIDFQDQVEVKVKEKPLLNNLFLFAKGKNFVYVKCCCEHVILVWRTQF